MRLPKHPFVFLQRNTKFYCFSLTFIRFSHQNAKFQSCTQTRTRVFTKKYRNTKFYGYTQTDIYFFHSEIQNFGNCTQTAIRSLTMKYKRLYLNIHSLFVHEIQNLKLLSNGHSFFLTTNNELVFRSSCNMITDNNNDIF